MRLVIEADIYTGPRSMLQDYSGETVFSVVDYNGPNEVRSLYLEDNIGDAMGFVRVPIAVDIDAE